MLPPRHQNVAQSIFDQSLDMIENHMYVEGAKDGWWACPYGCANGGGVGLSEETILRNTLGLKNVINSLLELRSSGGADPARRGQRGEQPAAQDVLRAVDVQPVHRLPPRTLGDIKQARAEAIEFQAGNTGRIVFRGSRRRPGAPGAAPG